MIRIRPSRTLAVAALLVVWMAGLGAVRALATDLGAAWADLDQLKRSTKSSKSTNEDLEQYLNAVANAYKGLDGPPKPADDAPDEEKKAYEVALAKFEKEQAKYRGEVEKQLLRLLTLVKAQNDTNVRDDVNIKAARALGDLAPHLDEKGRKSLSKDIMAAIEKNLTKVKTHQVNTDLLDAVFEALGKLDDEAALEWMLKNYVHTKDVEKQYLVAAHKAMVLFTNVEGKLRFEIVHEFVKTYAGVEAQAEQSSSDPKVRAKKDFWDAIKTYTIPVVQYYAGKPTNDEDVALSEMKHFEDWLRDHKNPRRPPWVDEKVEEGTK